MLVDFFVVFDARYLIIRFLSTGLKSIRKHLADYQQARRNLMSDFLNL